MVRLYRAPRSPSSTAATPYGSEKEKGKRKKEKGKGERQRHDWDLGTFPFAFYFCPFSFRLGGRRLMRARVESGGLEVAAGFFQKGAGAGRDLR